MEKLALEPEIELGEVRRRGFNRLILGVNRLFRT
jgi:hypothetical protein